MSIAKLIDFLGLRAQTEELVTAMDDKDALAVQVVKDYADNQDAANLQVAKNYADSQDAANLQAAKDYADTQAGAAAAGSIPLVQKGVPGGVAELNPQGIVPSHQLPSFVDDVIEGYRLGEHFYSDAAHTTIVTDETGQSADQLSGKIYVDLGDNKTYRWAGTDYAVISESLALGITEATAGRGDWTYTGYQHALAKGSQFASNLYKITTNAEGHVIAATAVTKADIVDLGIPAQDTTYNNATQSTAGLMSAADKAKLDGVEQGANAYTLPTMSESTKGGAKVGNGLHVESDALNLGPLTDSDSGAQVTTDGVAIYGVTGEGHAKQDTTTGKNLLPNNLVSQTVSGVTFTRLSDGGIRIQGTTNARNGGLMIASAFPLAAGTYTVSLGGGTINSPMRIAIESATTHVDVVSYLRSGSETFTVSSADTFNMYIVDAYSSPSTQDTVIYPQIESGSTATTYEPYTGGKPAPNPDYPQEIRVARGRNLVNKTITGANIEASGGVSASSEFNVYVAKVSAGKTYVATTGDAGLVAAFYTQEPSIGSVSYNGSRIIQNSSTVFIAPIDGYVAFRAEPQYTDIQLELGSQATPYVPYGYMGLEVDSLSRNISDWDNLAVHDYTGELISSASRVSNTKNSRFDNVMPGTTYTIAWDASNIQVALYAYAADGTYLPSESKIDHWYVSAFSWTPKTAAKIRIVLSYPNEAEISAQNAIDANVRIFTVTPVPLPSKGFLGALPDGTKDTLSIDSAGHVEGVDAIQHVIVDGSAVASDSVQDYGTFAQARVPILHESTGVYNQALSSHFVPRDEWTPSVPAIKLQASYLWFAYVGGMSAWANLSAVNSWFASNNDHVYYKLATPQSWDGGYIDLPALPEGAVVSIPELEEIGVEWWVEGTEEIVQHASDERKRIESLIAEKPYGLKRHMLQAQIAALEPEWNNTTSFPLPSYDGYTPITIQGIHFITTADLAIVGFRIYEDSCDIEYKNTSSSTVPSTTLLAYVLYVPDDLFNIDWQA